MSGQDDSGRSGRSAAAALTRRRPVTALPAISVALPPSRSIAEHARLAARLGYRRVLVFDSPALYGDI